jgi:methylated-DNA-[protein]-cysteine S-methyltransferase
VIADPSPFAALEAQLGEYFRGERRIFNLPLVFHGTEFQRRVWNSLLTIPYGETATYGELAFRLGNPNATNRIAIVVPCHRVVGANASLTGYAFGLARKERLLALEGALSN